MSEVAATFGSVIATPQRGLVRRPASAEAFVTERHPPGDELAPWIAYFWTVTWDRRDAGPLESTVIPFPAMHLTVEWGDNGSVRHCHPMPATLVHGLISRVFRVTLTGRGGVVGARFRADGFHCWTGLDAAALTDSVVPADSLAAPEIGALHLGLGPGSDPRTTLHDLRSALVRHRPAGRPSGVGGVVDRMATDPALVRVDQVAHAVGLSERTCSAGSAARSGSAPSGCSPGSGCRRPPSPWSRIRPCR